MYNENKLKLYSINLIMESSLSNKDKGFLLKELRNSDLYRTMDFLNKGQFYFGTISESNKMNIQDEFKDNINLKRSLNEWGSDSLANAFAKDANGLYISQNQLAAAAIGVAGVVGITTIIYLIRKIKKWIKMAVSKAERKCGNLEGVDKTRCISIVKKHIYQEAILKLNKLKSSCSKAKNKQSCISKIEEKIQVLKNRIDESNELAKSKS